MEEILRKKFYLSEFEFCDGNGFIRMNIVEICTLRNLITVAITNEGRISLESFDLKSSEQGLFFEYGRLREQIHVEDFVQVED